MRKIVRNHNFTWKMLIGLIVILIFSFTYKETIKNQITEIVIRFKEESSSEIDFDYWKTVNEDICAWIRIPGTNIDYPIVQSMTESNEYYLKHDINRSESIYGAIFIEKENKNDFSDINTIIYGHHMRDGSMFGSLEKYLESDYLDEHKTIQIELPTEKLEYEVVGATTYRAVHLLENTDYNPGNEPMIVLSTCSKAGDEYRCIVLAKLISKQEVNK